MDKLSTNGVQNQLLQTITRSIPQLTYKTASLRRVLGPDRSRAGKGETVAEPIRIELLAQLGEPEILGLSEVLIDCVQGGASVSFMLPISQETAKAFWRKVAASHARGERLVLAALDADGAIVGTVMLILDLPENQPHRADLAKMLVHRRARGRGVGAALLAAAERAALQTGRTLIVLDTVTGTPAERLYARHGWQRVGEIPRYALWPDGRPCPTTFYYKSLQPVG